MAAITVGDLSAAHVGVRFEFTPPPNLSGHAETLVGEMTRVQHNAPTLNHEGQSVPAQTLLVFGPWSGPLDPTHPIKIVEVSV